MTRLGAIRLVELAAALSSRERAITETVARLRLVSAPQLERLYFDAIPNPQSRGRLARRTLRRLVERGVLGRLARRIGGVRAGAAGHVYFVTSAGQRLAAYWQGEGLRRPRGSYEPSRAFVRHTLGISEVYVRLSEADRAGALELLAFEREPRRSFVGPGGARLTLRPDAYVRLGVSREEEERVYLEVDCATEGRMALARKCRLYVAAWRAGVEPVFPRVVWLTLTEQRAELLGEVCATLPADSQKLFAVTTPERAREVLTGHGGAS